jgi:hypothetical protein
MKFRAEGVMLRVIRWISVRVGGLAVAFTVQPQQ